MWKSLFRRQAPLGVKVLRFSVLLVGLFFVLFVGTAQPSKQMAEPTGHQLEPERLKVHVKTMSVDFAPRDYKRIWNLNKTADYIRDHFTKAGADVSEQVFEVDGKTFRNIIGLFGPETASRIVVGAHYDSCGDTPGADDNASGCAGLIELAYLLGKSELNQQVELVGYTLEEPPFFNTPNMGSARHAARHKKNNVDVKAMICLEMIGYFSDEPDSQRFPSPLLKLYYPDTGNFIGIVGSFGDAELVRQMKASMRGVTDLPVHSISAPREMMGVDYSDHRNYWNQGYTAVMITDTAFMRNRRYHTQQDTYDTLDYDRMAKVVLAVHNAILDLANLN